MTGDNSSATTSGMNIDTKRSSTAVMREALFRVTKEQKWTVDDEWAYFLKQRFAVFSSIAITHAAKNWEHPQVGRDIDNAFKEQAKGKIPGWAESMLDYDKAVEWMRRQHWKNNKNKPPLAASNTTESAIGPRVAGGGGAALSDDQAGISITAGSTPGTGNGQGQEVRYWDTIMRPNTD